jgi:hypothetical protein
MKIKCLDKLGAISISCLKSLYENLSNNINIGKYISASYFDYSNNFEIK